MGCTTNKGIPLDTELSWISSCLGIMFWKSYLRAALDIRLDVRSVEDSGVWVTVFSLE